MTVAEAIRRAAERISKTSDSARVDAELLMAHALDAQRSDMLLRQMEAAKPEGFQALVARRAAHEPVAYITGWTEFYGRRFGVEPGVLIPRDDSEVLIEAALQIAPHDARVLDMGTGSGALLLTLLAERPSAQGIGIDASPDAIRIATANAAALLKRGEIRADTAAAFYRKDWKTARWADDLGQFDLILCNPPYVESGAELSPDVREYEPSAALFAGPEGLDDYRIIIPQLRNLLTEGGVAVVEIGHQQAREVKKIAEKHRFTCELRQDLAGRDRCLIMRWDK